MGALQRLIRATQKARGDIKAAGKEAERAAGKAIELQAVYVETQRRVEAMERSIELQRLHLGTIEGHIQRNRESLQAVQHIAQENNAVVQAGLDLVQAGLIDTRELGAQLVGNVEQVAGPLAEMMTNLRQAGVEVANRKQELQALLADFQSGTASISDLLNGLGDDSNRIRQILEGIVKDLQNGVINAQELERRLDKLKDLDIPGLDPVADAIAQAALAGEI
ncbi:MAG: hypothetical protein AAGC60_00265 [Acidobacteriota bacterium]